MDDLVRMGKYVSMLLRHHPEEAGVWLTDHVPVKYLKESRDYG